MPRTSRSKVASALNKLTKSRPKRTKKNTTTASMENAPDHLPERRAKTKEILDKNAHYLHAYRTTSSSCPLSFRYVPSGADLTATELECCLGFVEMTSGHDYRKSSWGWNAGNKKKEMEDDRMMYLLICQDPPVSKHGHANDGRTAGVHVESEQGEEHASIAAESATRDKASNSPHIALGDPIVMNSSHTGRILGFISFMFDYDDPPHDTREVVYIYEIHLHDGLRGKGIGSDLIRFAELAATSCDITKTMLTVFTANTGASGLYKRLGYSKDECSPRPRATRTSIIQPDYQIMSKELS